MTSFKINKITLAFYNIFMYLDNYDNCIYIFLLILDFVKVALNRILYNKNKMEFYATKYIPQSSCTVGI